METCFFYKQEVIRFENREIQSHQQYAPGPGITAVWCNHPKHSPAKRVEVVGRVGGGVRLGCQGEFALCSIPEALFDDVV